MLGLTVHTVDDGSVIKQPLYSGASYSLPIMAIHHRGSPFVTNMEENEGWAMFRRTIIIVAILLLILAPIFLYVYLERGLEGAIDFFADRIIGVMFAGLLAGAFVLFDKLSNKLFNKQD